MEVDKVVRLDVVGVFLVHFAGQNPALLFVSEPQQVLGQLDPGGQVVRIEFQRLALAGGSFGEAVVLRQLAANQTIHPRILRPELQGIGPAAGNRIGIVRQMGQHGLVGPSVRVPGIDRQRPVQGFGRRIAVFAVDLMLSQQNQGRHVPGVDVQGGVQRGDHGFAIALVERLRQAVVYVRVVAEPLDRFLVFVGGQFVVLLGYRQRADGKVRLAAVRIAPQGHVVEVLQDNPRLDPECQQRPAQSDHLIATEVFAAAVAGDSVDHREHLIGLVGPAILLIDRMRQRQEADIRAGVSDRGVGALGRFLVPAQRHQGFDFEQPPLDGIGAVFDGLLRRFQGFLVLACPELVACGIRIRGGPRGPHPAAGQDNADQHPQTAATTGHFWRQASHFIPTPASAYFIYFTAGEPHQYISCTVRVQPIRISIIPVRLGSRAQDLQKNRLARPLAALQAQTLSVESRPGGTHRSLLYSVLTRRGPVSIICGKTEYFRAGMYR